LIFCKEELENPVTCEYIKISLHVGNAFLTEEYFIVYNYMQPI